MVKVSVSYLNRQQNNIDRGIIISYFQRILEVAQINQYFEESTKFLGLRGADIKMGLKPVTSLLRRLSLMTSSLRAFSSLPISNQSEWISIQNP